MKNLPLYEDWLFEDNLAKANVFKQKMTGDTHLDMRDFWRKALGEDDEE